MPLDDVYIHFQYAREMAAGEPYVYNPGLPPTSGATSFLYPYMLAAGYLLGFQGLNLGLWAMLLGMVALACSTWLVYRLVLAFGAPGWLAVLAGILFAMSGPVSWHFMSGMETGWVILFTLGTLYSLIIYPHPLTPSPLHGEGGQMRARHVIVLASLLALIRPEGGILAALAMMALWTQVRKVGAGTRYISSLLIPILAIGVQPLVNLLLTGSAVASGNAAKSVFGVIPFAWGVVIGRILDQWRQLWTELLTGSSPREGLYIAPLMLVVAGIGIIRLLWERRWRAVGLVLIGWLAIGTLAVSTLDTAFWHFKRYQMPFIALLFPLAGWGLVGIWDFAWGSAETAKKMGSTPSGLYRIYTVLTTVFRDPITDIYVRRERADLPNLGVVILRGGMICGSVFAFVVAVSTAVQFLHHYALNVDYIYQQPLQMARWLEANTPPDAVIAVHDVGMIRYLGGRTTLDIVGLTTPGAADYWRNGPGSVAEFLIQQRPDYIASYGHGHGFGLGMLADTSLYGAPLASFPVDLDDRYNVALAADFQGIYQPEWVKIFDNRLMYQGNVSHYRDGLLQDGYLSDYVNVGNINSERVANYGWPNENDFHGFSSEVHEFDYMGACIAVIRPCSVIDGGRSIDKEETFTMNTTPGEDAILITRIHPFQPGSFDVYADDYLVGTRIISAIPGTWLEIMTLISSKFIASEKTHFRIVPHISDGYYMPYYHWLMQGTYQTEQAPREKLTEFQDRAIVVISASIDYRPDNHNQVIIFVEWYTDGSAQGDYKVFVHMLDDSDQIVAQSDVYPGNGTLPPGNWLPGVLRDTIMVDLGQTPPGKYHVAIGLYDPYTFERLPPAGGDDRNRFFIGDVEIE